MKYILVLLYFIPSSAYSKDLLETKRYCVKMLYDKQNILEYYWGRDSQLTKYDEIDQAFNLGQYIAYRDLLYVIDYE